MQKTTFLNGKKTVHCLLTLLIVFLPVQPLFAKTTDIDKLTRKVIDKSIKLEKTKPELAYQLLVNAEKLVRKQGGLRLKYKVYHELGRLETNRKDYKKAIIANLNGLRVAKETGDQLLIAIAHHDLAKAYKPLKLYDEVDDNLKSAEAIYKKLGQEDKLANVSVFQGHNSVDRALQKKDPRLLDVARGYYNRSLKYYRKKKDARNETIVIIALGNLYLRYYALKQLPQYIQKSIDYSETGMRLIGYDSTNTSAAYCIANIGEAYGLIGDHKKEQYYYECSLPLYRKAGHIAATHEQLLLLAGSYTATAEYDKAYRFLEEYLNYDKEFPVSGGKRSYYEKMAELLYARGDYSAAYRYRILFEESNDFHLQEQKEQEIMRLQVVNELLEKDKQIAFLRENERLHSSNLAKQSVIRNLLLGGVAFTLLMIVLLYFRYKEKNKLTRLMVEKNIELQKLSIVASKTMNGVIITDKDGRPEWMNEGYKRMFGWESIDDFLYHLGNDFLSLSSLTEQELRGYQTAAVRDKRSITYQSVNSTKSGRRLDIQTSMTPVFDDSGELSYWVLVETDVTEINVAREVAEREQKITENALKIQELFIANVSHEIRTPMNGIMGLSRQMNDSAITGQQKELASAILKTSSGLLHVVNDLLDMSKIRAGKMNFRVVPFELRSTIENLKRTVQIGIEEKGLAYSCTRHGEVPDWVSGDAGRLNQILLNLVGNAVKFTEKGAIRLDIRLVEKTQEMCVLAFSVEDTGPGIPPEKQQFVFESFAQLEDHHTRSTGGTGLGLSICKTLTEAMGGKIMLHSEEGKGSVFTVELPFLLVNEQEIPEAVDVAAGDVLEGKRILLVEDNKVNQRVASYELTSWGAAVSIANNAEEAFDFLREQLFDLVLMDISMPKIDGLQATQMIRSDFPENVRNLPIIAMTASAMTSDFSRYLQAGMNDAISKPYEPEQLLTLILKWLNKTDYKPQEAAVEVQEVPETTLIDLSVLHSRAKGDKEYLREMFQVFLDNMPAYIRDLSASIRDNDLEEVRSDAHRMLGPSRLFGLVTITRNLERMEDREQKDVVQLEEWLQQIEEDYKAVDVFIRDELDQLEHDES